MRVARKFLRGEMFVYREKRRGRRGSVIYYGYGEDVRMDVEGI